MHGFHIVVAPVDRTDTSPSCNLKLRKIYLPHVEQDLQNTTLCYSSENHDYPGLVQ